MSWRTVIISSRCKLDLKMGYLVVRGEEVRRIFLDEIALLMIENPAVALTGCLLSALAEKKIKVIFCDRKHTPQSEMIPIQGSYDSSGEDRIMILPGASPNGNGAVRKEYTAGVAQKSGNA